MTNHTDFRQGVGFQIQTNFDTPATLQSSLYDVEVSVSAGTPISPISPVGPYRVKLWITVGSEADTSDQARVTRSVGFTTPGATTWPHRCGSGR